MKTKTFKKAFSSIEILIVVGIAALVLAFAVPYFLSAKIRANETAAVANLGRLASGFETYRLLNSTYPASFTSLLDTQPPLIDNNLASGSKQGYDFTLSTDSDLSSVNSFRIFASPTETGVTGKRSFKIGSSTQEANGVAYYASGPSGPWAPIGYGGSTDPDLLGDDPDEGFLEPTPIDDAIGGDPADPACFSLPPCDANYCGTEICPDDNQG